MAPAFEEDFALTPEEEAQLPGNETLIDDAGEVSVQRLVSSRQQVDHVHVVKFPSGYFRLH